MTEKSEEAEFSSRLRELRFHRKLQFFLYSPLLLLFIVVPTLIAAHNFWPDAVQGIGSSLLYQAGTVFLMIAGFVGMFANMLLNYKFYGLKCPQCGGLFHARISKRWGACTNGFNRKCMNCDFHLSKRS